MNRSFAFLAVIKLFVRAADAQHLSEKIIRGSVTDAKTGEPLPSANISVESTYRGTISNQNGNYSLSIPDSLLPATVVVRYISYQTR